MNNQLPGEFTLSMWKESGLNIPSTVKRGNFTIDEKLAIQKIGQLQQADIKRLDVSLLNWLGFTE
jgi:hypothetical protein